MKYPSVDAVRKPLSKEPGALMAKVDIESAYQNVPMHPDDWPPHGMQCRGKVFIDMVLPFG